MLLCSPWLRAHEQGKIAKLWQGYAELGMPDKLLTELETESRKGDSTREPELIRTLLTYWEPIMQQRSRYDVACHWDGDGVYGFIGYRTKDLPPEMVQQRRAYQAKRGITGEEEQQQLIIALLALEDAYIYSAPDAEKIDLLIRTSTQRNTLGPLRCWHSCAENTRITVLKPFLNWPPLWTRLNGWSFSCSAPSFPLALFVKRIL